ncbi:DNA internalization-related competence protein ComEC/Rec2 [Endozoicomonas sp. OPT23]|uniref:DNA internalization-related competence protein ComEC/Rec2 n=1 Tax=Endozoicomonas sp. OPT23 TaxID=2072845 RepID=UPI00129B165D|nr:DNA internalization-related competence protein ComEC/Rec2 [Endozoicomonas sp. OPT23]MRI35243.1 DNA internalization-related competence protein ComEC/Rec2 [Endozoicomonas sp. OPT23]
MKLSITPAIRPINLRDSLSFFIAGLLISVFLPLTVPLPLVMAIGLLMLLLIVLVNIAGIDLQAFTSMTAFFLIGFIVGTAHGILLQKQWLPSALEGKDLFIKGKVSGLPSGSSGLTRFQFLSEEIGGEKQLPGKLWLSWYRSSELMPDQEWQLKVRLRHPRGSYSRGAFDREAWAAREGVIAVGYVKEGELLSGSKSLSVGTIRSAIRGWLQQSTSPDNAAVLSAILIGDKSGLSQQQWDNFNNTGTTHLMVISGLHIGMVAVLGFWLVLVLARTGLIPLRVVSLPVLASITSLILAFGYALLAGFNIPVQRALVMTSVVLAGPLLGIKARPSTLYLLAMAVVLLIEPLAATSAGFWYSFAAVAILLYGCCGRVREGESISMQWLRPQLWVFFMLSPLLMQNQQTVNLLSPLINLLAIPLLGMVVLPLAFLALTVQMFFEPLSSFLLMLLEVFLAGWGKVMAWLSENDLSLPVLSCEPWQLVFVSVAVLLLLSVSTLKLRWLVLFFLSPWLFPVKTVPETGEAKVSVIDVGQGLSVLIQTHNHAMLYDTGVASRGRFNSASSTIIPYIAREQISQLDLIMVSHGDEDHSGGLSALLKRYPGVPVVAGSSVGHYSGHISHCNRGEQWRWDHVRFEVLSGSEPGLKSNERSCVLKITAQNGRSILLAGDISRKKEAALVSDGLINPSDFLLLPHHGSKHSSSSRFLEKVSASQLLVSAGYGNRFGHPAKATLERIKELGVDLKNTAKSGTLSFILGAGFDEIKSFRQQYNYYWWR